MLGLIFGCVRNVLLIGERKMKNNTLRQGQAGLDTVWLGGVGQGMVGQGFNFKRGIWNAV